MNFSSYLSLHIINNNSIKNSRRDIIIIRIASLISRINYYLKIRLNSQILYYRYQDHLYKLSKKAR